MRSVFQSRMLFHPEEVFSTAERYLHYSAGAVSGFFGVEQYSTQEIHYKFTSKLSSDLALTKAGKKFIT